MIARSNHNRSKIATPRSNESTICTSNTVAATPASGSAFAIDLTAEEEPELAATNFQIQGSAASAQPLLNVFTVPLRAGTNEFAIQVCPRTRVAAQALLISRTSDLLCSVRRAMISVRFSEEEASSKSLQRRIQRFLLKLQIGPPQIIECITAKEAAAAGVKEISGLTSNLDMRSTSTINNNNNNVIAPPINMAGSIHTQATAIVSADALPLKRRRTAKQYNIIIKSNLTSRSKLT